MKALTILFVSCLLSSPAAMAQGGPPPHAGQGNRAAAGAAGELAALEQFLALSDEELASIEQAIARVRAMTPEQRAEYRERLISYRNLPAPRRAEVRLGWGWQNPQDREDWREMMRGATEERRSAIHAELQAAAPEQVIVRRREILEAWRQSR
jgi:hypothetical protein